MAETTQLGVGLLGFGNVGRAVLDLLIANQSIIRRRAGCGVVATAALVRDPARHLGTVPAELRLTTDVGTMLADPGIHVVVDAMGGLHPAREYVLQALASGRPAVLANKELLATAGRELFAAAAHAGVDLFFEASVCSGMPVLRALRDGLAGDRVTGLAGVLNGTTNYVLTRMESGVPLDRAIAEAQAAGYAETDPRSDLEGRDAAWKLAILSSIAFGRRVLPGLVASRGLDGLAGGDLESALGMGLRLKQVAMARLTGEGAVEAWVAPVFVPADHPLARIEGVENGLMLSAAAAGRIVLTGPGAGGPSAASAIVADLIEAARNLRQGVRSSGCVCDGEACAAGRERPARFWMRLDGPDAATGPSLDGIPVERSVAAGGQVFVITGPTEPSRLEGLAHARGAPRPIPIFEEPGTPVSL
ncbi:MAG: homoserine dehydrogenase [Bacillota bacterium]|nr:homoserine dehydrogenase [Bacillota bacterium]